MIQIEMTRKVIPFIVHAGVPALVSLPPGQEAFDWAFDSQFRFSHGWTDEKGRRWKAYRAPSRRPERSERDSSLELPAAK